MIYWIHWSSFSDNTVLLAETKQDLCRDLYWKIIWITNACKYLSKHSHKWGGRKQKLKQGFTRSFANGGFRAVDVLQIYWKKREWMIRDYIRLINTTGRVRPTETQTATRKLRVTTLAIDRDDRSTRAPVRNEH